jgi:hypothetical protein
MGESNDKFSFIANLLTHHFLIAPFSSASGRSFVQFGRIDRKTITTDSNLNSTTTATFTRQHDSHFLALINNSLLPSPVQYNGHGVV